MTGSRILWSVVFGLSALLCATYGGELFAYPADVVVQPHLENARNRTPIFIPGRCGHNEILYPGDQLDDWVCDCRPGHVFYPASNGCYALFTQGFCKPGEYVELTKPSKIAICSQNSCEKNRIPFREQCVELNRNNGICPKVKRKSYVVGVNETTLELDCIISSPTNLDMAVADRYMEDSELPPGAVLFMGANRCAYGTRTYIDGNCTEPVAEGNPTQQ